MSLTEFIDGNRFSSASSRKVLRPAVIFALVIVYCFYADRTQIWNKYPKWFRSGDFLSLCVACLLIGILSIRRSYPPLTSGKPTRSSDQPFLSRDQTDEWKGWMQFIILIYHYTGASNVLWIYQIVRLLVASYLFMTGFGHTVYFYKKRDFSLRRVAAVLVRLNLLSCVLPYVMRTDYLFYYFAPLVSFWFLVVYFTMRIQSHRNHSVFLLLKIVASALLVTAFTKIPYILETVFMVLRFTCNIHWDAKEWRFRVWLDMFIVYIGMICAVIYVELSDASSKFSLGRSKALNYLRYIRHGAVVAAVIILPGYFALIHRSPDKYDYNWWHPWMAFLPVVSFVILRNSHRILRNHHSAVFAWLGRCSLETFTLQFHIWLAGDTRGLLDLGIFKGSHAWSLNFATTTVIFLYVSWNVAAATGIITGWILDSPLGKSENENSVGDERKDSEALLPLRMNGNTAISGSAVGGTEVKGNIRKGLFSRTDLFSDDLRRRIGLIFGIMWFMNVVSSIHMP